MTYSSVAVQRRRYHGVRIWRVAAYSQGDPDPVVCAYALDRDAALSLRARLLAGGSLDAADYWTPM